MAETTGHGTHGTSLRDYLRVLRRRKWIILQAVILVPAVAIGLSLRQEKAYKATAEVLLVQQNVSNQLNGFNDPSGYQQPDRRAQTQADLARVPLVGKSALELAGTPRRSVDNFLKHSSASVKTNSDLLELSAWDHDPARAMALADAYAKAFSQFRAELDTDSYANARKRANEQLAELAAGHHKDTAIYRHLLSKRDELDQIIALLTRNAVPVKIPDQAVQIQPRPVRNGILGLALGLVLGIGLAFLREALDTRVRTSEEVGERLGVPILGRLAEPPRRIRAKDELVMVVQPHGPQAEAFRTLRTNVDFANLGREAHTIMVTSAVQAEGKSTTVANLAVAMARAGRSVILVDLDFRRPYVERFFDVGDRPGLTDVALGYAPLDDAILSVAVTRESKGKKWALDGAAGTNGNGSRNGHSHVHGVLDVLAVGPVPPNGGDFIGSSPVGELLERLRSMYDVVLIDSPPLLRVGDGIALSGRVDGLIVVGRLQTLRKATLNELGRVLETVPAAKLGCVVTGSETEDDSPYGYGGSYYYSRRQEQERDRMAEVR
jgi:succinoglycan biosynthesis transport protein ExoP